MLIDQLKPNLIVRGPVFPEPVQIIVVTPQGDSSVKLVGKDLGTGLVHDLILGRRLAGLLGGGAVEFAVSRAAVAC